MRKASIFLILTTLLLILGCVQQDTNPPTYKELSSNVSTTFRGDVVKFSAYWVDDVALDSYIFSWDAGGANCDTWENFTKSFAGGKAEYSEYVATIPEACAGKDIGYRFYAKDKAGNWNFTEIKRISVAQKGSAEEILYQASKKLESVTKLNESLTITYTVVLGDVGFLIKANGEAYRDMSLNKSKVVLSITVPSPYGGGAERSTVELYTLPEGMFECTKYTVAEEEKYSCRESTYTYEVVPTANLSTLTMLRALGMINTEYQGVRTYAGRSCDYISINVPKDKFKEVMEALSMQIPGEGIDWKKALENATGSMNIELCLDREVGDAIYTKMNAEIVFKIYQQGKVNETPFSLSIEATVTRISKEVDPSVFELPVPWEEVQWLPKFTIVNVSGCQANSNVVKVRIRAMKDISGGEAKLTASWWERTQRNLTSVVGVGSMKPGDETELTFALSESLPANVYVTLKLSIAGSESTYYCSTYTYRAGIPEPLRWIIPLVAPITGSAI